MSWKKIKERAQSGSFDPGIWLTGKVAPQLSPYHKYVKPILAPETVDAPDEELLDPVEMPTDESEEVLSAGRLAAINAKKRKGRASTIMSGGLGDTGAQGGRTILG